MAPRSWSPDRNGSLRATDEPTGGRDRNSARRLPLAGRYQFQIQAQGPGHRLQIRQLYIPAKLDVADRVLAGEPGPLRDGVPRQPLSLAGGTNCRSQAKRGWPRAGRFSRKVVHRGGANLCQPLAF